MGNNTDTIKKALHWFLESGIQNPDHLNDVEGDSLSGSFNAWYDPREHVYSYVYIEISGYALTTLLYAYRHTGDEVYLERAKHVGEWLLDVQHKTGGYPTALYHAEGSFQKPDEFHTFDVGMVLNGLVQLYRITKDDRYVDAAKWAADWIITYQKEDGSVAAQIGATDGKVKDTDRTWSTQSGPYHAKCAIGLINLYDVTKEDAFKKAATKLCDYALTCQKEDGQYLTYGDLDGTNLHPHIYTAEGLYVVGSYLKEEKYLESSHRATEWVLSYAKDGLVPRHKHGETLNYNERVDILSQAVRMARLHGIENSNVGAIVETIKGYQYDGEVESQKGGFVFGKQTDGTPAPHINSWVTMFALQALMLDGGDEFESVFELV